MTDHNPLSTNRQEIQSKLERYFEATLSPEETLRLADEATALLHSGLPVPDENLEADLRLVAAIGKMPPAFSPDMAISDLSRRITSAIHEAATAEQRLKARKLVIRRRWIAAASVAVLLLSAVTFRNIMPSEDLSVSGTYEPILSASSQHKTPKSPILNPVISVDAKSNTRRNISYTPIKDENYIEEENTYNISAPDDNNTTFATEIPSDTDIPHTLPHPYVIPDENDDSFLLASQALDQSTRELDNIYTSSEQSVAKVALVLENIFSELGFSISEEDNSSHLSI